MCLVQQKLKVTALVPWYGSNRMNAQRVGQLFQDCCWVGLPFAGGMCEIAQITARTIMANDLHRGIISLAKIVKQQGQCKKLLKALRGQLFHPDTLREAQHRLANGSGKGFQNAMDYFTVAWMSRSCSAGTKAEKKGQLAVRWQATGGDSVKRYQSAIDSLPAWCEHFQRCQFQTRDCFEFLEKCKDRNNHGIYCDPPFYGPCGKQYLHNCGDDLVAQAAWHRKLATKLDQYDRTRIVMRAYDGPFVRQLYPEPSWTWNCFEGRKQSNDFCPEALIVKN